MPMAPKVLRTTRAKRVERRPSSSERGYTEAWKRASYAWLMDQFAQGNVYCGECGKLLTGQRRDIHVDHIVDHKGNQDLFWDTDNWQALHARCHSVKTARENRVGRMGSDAHI